MTSERFKALRVEVEGEQVERQVTLVDPDVLPDNDVTIEVRYSSLNYKDALSASGNRGVTKRFPHTPGIDAAGTVTASKDARFSAGDEVLVTGYDLGMDTPGGFGQYIRVPADWIVPLPAGLDAREAMILGTAGFTAAMGVAALMHQGVEPASGPVLVTGATGGVGCLAVALLAGRGFEVVAGTGKSDAHDWLRELGAAAVIGRSELAGPGERPLLSAKWAAAIDTVGGQVLEQVVKTLDIGGAVAACGNVAGPELHLTVYPFILRGVSLLGIDSQHYPMPRRRELWSKLASDWKPEALESVATEVGLEELSKLIDAILEGRIRGRVLVRHDHP